MPRLFGPIERRAEEKLKLTTYTYPHSKRVARFMGALVKEAVAQGVDVFELGVMNERHARSANALRPDAPEVGRVLGRIHDVGKRIVSERHGHGVWEKKGLDPRERDVIQTHPAESYWFIRGIPHKYSRMLAEFALFHHERFDGTGYPTRLKGKQIPMLDRLHFIADTLDAIRFPRPYKFGPQRMSFNAAVAEIRRGSGTQFDPRAVSVFTKMVRDKHPALKPFMKR